MKNKFYVYEHWHPQKNSCFSVGKGKDRRGYSTLGRNKKHIAVQKELESLDLQMEVRIIAYDLTEDAAFALERERIAHWRDLGIDLANATSGGQGMAGMHLSDEHKRKLAQLHTGRKHSPETLKKMSQPRKNKHIFTEEEKQKLREAMLGNKYSLGRKHTDEWKAAMSKIHKGRISPMKGRKHSEETRKKMSLARMGHKNNLGRKLTEEHKKLLSLRMKGNTYSKGIVLSEEAKQRKREIAIKANTPEVLERRRQGILRAHARRKENGIPWWSEGKPGIMTGRKHSTESRAKMSASRKAYVEAQKAEKSTAQRHE